MGLFEEPIRPTMRDETVTKKAPKMITNKPNNNLLPIEVPGINLSGRNAIIKTKSKLPIPTTFNERSFSVRKTDDATPPSFFKEPKLPLNDETIVGIVFINVIKPPAATAPAPICPI